ncbi:heparan-alpha-glucosaminide N-acetyltransferase-like isoform X2 [Chrysoperla carnea]|uniref:heparan-alpha-glucosaminide N-acetyltransferase-like isoform X2 n=1 Tax=Chrysoperla carnea TaxID=189513 RepID=UPI001D07C20B|nr:heparan-alpha-glucosaminide N-acetyltransferase-like isoform X2 [Chrysoperla carnea]
MSRQKCINKSVPLIYDEACLDIVSTSPENLFIHGQSAECFLCDTKPLAEVEPFGNTSILINTTYAYKLDFEDNQHLQWCNEFYKFEENGIYGWNVSNRSCSSIYIKEAPDNAFLPLIGAFIVFLLFGTIWYGIKCIYRSGCTSSLRHRIAKFSELENDLGSPLPVASTSSTPPQIKKRPGSGRIKSLDVFRGFTIVLMIFVNYGGGQYSFFKHSVWNGLTVADVVFPWFAWIMGVSTALSVRSSLRAGVSRRKLWRHAFVRAISLIIIGISLNTVSSYSQHSGEREIERSNTLLLDHWGTESSQSSRDPHSIENLRIPGVLQRLAVSGFFVAILEIMFMQLHASLENSRLYMFSDIIESWRQWFVVTAVVLTHTCITFLMSVPGCPTGYLWPGGLHHYGEYSNCTGGAAGYIDRLVFGPNHLYLRPTFKKIYETDVPYDPEGLLGTLTCILCVYLGVQAGRIMLTYNTPKARIVRLLAWGIFTGLLGGWLCSFSENKGPIPINKNLWSLSYVLVTSGLAFCGLTIIYILVDITKHWGGRPLFYPGMNSIFIYIGHVLTKNMFPWAWSPKYYTHREFVFMNLWGTFLWVAIAVFLYKKRIILKL